MFRLGTSFYAHLTVKRGSIMEKLSTFPQPKKFGLLGNLPLIDKDSPSSSFDHLVDEWGPNIRLELPGRSFIVTSDPEIVKEVCDETRFDKNIGHLLHVRSFAGDGLFTAWTEEINWQKAHRILLPAFSQPAMKAYHSKMVDIALQLVQKWSRLNTDESIRVPEDMTRLTLDTIGLCGFNYRFNSFYRETPIPFILSMVRALDEAMHKGNRLPIQDQFMVLTKRQFDRDIQTMFSLVDRLISDRKNAGDKGENDLLARMLNATDPETGESLDDANIRYQMITFLIAGHETTSGLLSFAIYFLLKHPEVLQKAYEEVDAVFKSEVPTYQEVLQLKYIRMILNEALRLYPTAPGFALYAKEDTVVGGKYKIQKGEVVFVHIPKLHRDKKAWGEDAEEFRPERFADLNQVPNHAYKPFGNGQRACIGMQFALHEASLVLGMILQKFQLIDHMNYQLKIKQTLTLKPDDLTIRVQLRETSNFLHMAESQLNLGVETKKQEEPRSSVPKILGVNQRPLLVLYGSDMGTASRIAKELADLAQFQGIRSEVAPANQYIGKLPTEGALLIITSSYNGKPPSNAREFVQWLEQVDEGQLKGVNYSVLGCGDHNWSSTYQAVPRWIDEKLAEKGANRFSARGEADASGDFEKDLDNWKAQMLADAVKTFNLQIREQEEKDQGTLNIQFVSGFAKTPLAESYQAFHGVVRDNRELQHVGSGRSTRHIEIELPADVSYQEGDHLGIFACNRRENVKRVIKRFHLTESDQLILRASGSGASHLPLNQPVALVDLLQNSVELQEAATRAQIREIASYTLCPPHKRELENLLEKGIYEEQILKKRVTMLDLLEKYEACEIPFERFLELLPALKPRYYSISSSPRIDPHRLSISVGVVAGPAWNGQGEYYGVASHYLAERQPGEHVVAFIRTPESGFQLPENPETPILMVGAGTGIAPYRGFLQARSVLQKQGKSLGLAHLYFGCRNEADFIYREEWKEFERNGLVKLHMAFSRKEGMPKTYVQHLLAQNAQEVISILEKGGRLYVCGDGRKMAPEVDQEMIHSYQKVYGVQEKDAEKWLQQLMDRGQYVKDVWAN